jgi:nucleotide-binding universal stress UspA family protein
VFGAEVFRFAALETAVDSRTIKKILVATDFSESSAQARTTAIGFAQVFKASIEIVHVYVEPVYVLPPPVDLAIFPFDVANVLAKVQESLAAERERVQAAGVPCETVALSGKAAPEIVAHAKATGADLIVMGRHGRSGFEHALLGSVAERVVHHTPCPVLVVPTPRPIV